MTFRSLRKNLVILALFVAAGCASGVSATKTSTDEEPPLKARTFTPDLSGARRAASYALAQSPGHVRFLALLMSPEPAPAPRTTWERVERNPTDWIDPRGIKRCDDLWWPCRQDQGLGDLLLLDSRDAADRGGREDERELRFPDIAALDAYLSANPVPARPRLWRQMSLFEERVVPASSAGKFFWSYREKLAPDVRVEERVFCGPADFGIFNDDAECVAFENVRALSLVTGVPFEGLRSKPIAPNATALRAALAEAQQDTYARIGFELRVRDEHAYRRAVLLYTVSEFDARRVCGRSQEFPQSQAPRCYRLDKVKMIQVWDDVIQDGPIQDWDHRIGGIPFRVEGAASGIRPLNPGAPIGDLRDDYGRQTGVLAVPRPFLGPL